MKLFQDPLIWTNYELPGASDEKAAAIRRAQWIAQNTTGPVSTTRGPATTTDEAAAIQKFSEDLSAALADVGKYNLGAARQILGAAGIQAEGSINGKKLSLMELDYGRPVFFVSRDAASNVQVQVDQLQSGGALGLSLDGSPLGTVYTDRSVDIWDEGSPLTTHDDLQQAGGGGSRIFNMDSSAVSSHATFMAGIIGALGLHSNGTTTTTGAGQNAKITAWDFNSDRTEMAGRALGAARVSNQSYGQPVGWTVVPYQSGSTIILVLAWLGDIGISTAEAVDFGRYTALSKDYDLVALGKQWTLQVRAAGNERNSTESYSGWGTVGATRTIDGITGFYLTFRNGVLGFYNGSRFYPDPPVSGSYTSVSGTPPSDGTANNDTLTPDSCAKNMLTVGAVDASNNLAAFSSYGPTDDGRIKPEIVSPGVSIFGDNSTSTTATTTGSGTSQATALVTGAAALLAQHQENFWGAKEPMAASTEKALLVHTALNLGAAGPHYDTGYGVMQAADAATTVESNYYAENTDGNGTNIKLRTFIKEVVIPESEWIRIDLGADTATTGADLNWAADYASGYVIEGSLSASPDTYVPLASGYGAVGGTEAKTWSSTTVRYVRLVALTRARPNGVSLNEITVKNGATNLSLNKTVTASSQLAAGQAPAKAVDGSTSTRWASVYAGVTEYPWVQIDLGSAVSSNKAVITWDTNYATEFYLEGAANASGPYTQIGSVTASTGTANTVNFPSAVSYRYIRLVAQKLSGAAGVSVREFQIYNTSTLLSGGKTAIANSRTSATYAASKVTDNDLTSTRWESEVSSNPGARFALKATGGIIRATAAWTDAAGPESPNQLDNPLSALVNDIDGRIFKNATSGVRVETKPWILNPASPTSAATRGDNFRDNLEQIETASAVANALYTYELRPKMGRRIVGRQRISLVFSGIQQIPMSLFQVVNTSLAFDSPNNQVAATLTWTSVAGQNYRAQWSSNLSTWYDISGDVTGNGDTTTSTFVVSPIPSPSAYFRIKTVPVNPFNIP